MRLKRCHLEAALLVGTSLHVTRRLVAANTAGSVAFTAGNALLGSSMTTESIEEAMICAGPAVDAITLVALTILSIWQELTTNFTGEHSTFTISSITS